VAPTKIKQKIEFVYTMRILDMVEKYKSHVALFWIL
jgi:hypothetical protein